MAVLFIIIGVMTVALLVATVIGRFDSAPAPDPVRPFGHQELPQGGFAATDVDDVRFDTVVRGYKMSEVDGVLDRLQERQAQLEEQVRALGGDPATSTVTAADAAAITRADDRTNAVVPGPDRAVNPRGATGTAVATTSDARPVDASVKKQVDVARPQPTAAPVVETVAEPVTVEPEGESVSVVEPSEDHPVESEPRSASSAGAVKQRSAVQQSAPAVAAGPGGRTPAEENRDPAPTADDDETSDATPLSRRDAKRSRNLWRR